MGMMDGRKGKDDQKEIVGHFCGACLGTMILHMVCMGFIEHRMGCWRE